MKKTAIIIGAGPAGLTAAYEFLTRTDIVPIILEKSTDIGGLSKTVNYKGNRMDIGGHRFFSKSDRVMNWWLNILPIEKNENEHISINYQRQSYELNDEMLHKTITDPSKVMLIRNRLSRIYYNKKFFSYPVSISIDTLKNLGLVKTLRICFSYTKAVLFPLKNETSLEDFFINRFGKELYETFFKDYTEKVWGSSCKEIPAEWGKQRIKELSVRKAIAHAIQKNLWPSKKGSIAQKKTETSLIEKFLYPKFGPGQLWEEVANIIISKGGEIHFKQDVKQIIHANQTIESVVAYNGETQETCTFNGDFFFSTMPVKELIGGLNPAAPATIGQIADKLQYRDYITVGLLVKKLAFDKTKEHTIKDNWIYIQESYVKIGRLQIYNNWSPAMVNNPEHVWLGLEYFCNVDDELWQLQDDAFVQFAINELCEIGFINAEDVLDGNIVRMEKTYPAYFGSYDRFSEIRDYVNTFENLFLIGRNGMHKYNNSDHSMLTAMIAVDNIIAKKSTRENIWSVNTEEDYHEEK
jgi:protoporphyrinogen oxidase